MDDPDLYNVPTTNNIIMEQIAMEGHLHEQELAEHKHDAPARSSVV